MDRQVLPRFGTTPLIKITNAAVRAWVAEMLDAGLSAATARKAVFALRRCLAAAMADRRLMSNPAVDVPSAVRAGQDSALPVTDRGRALGRGDVPDRYHALVLVGAYGGLRWGEAVGLTRANVDVLRSRIIVETTAVEVQGKVTLGHEPKTRRSKRTVPVARSVMRRIEEHLAEYVGRGVGRADVHRPTWRSAVPLDVRPGGLAAGRRTRPAWTASPSTGCGTASSPSWSPPAATFARSPSGPATTASPSR